MSLRSIAKIKKTIRTYVTSLFILSMFAFVIAQPHLFAVEEVNEVDVLRTQQVYQEIIANNERPDDGSLQFENIIVGNTWEPTITYRVTWWDTLLSIANNFWTTVDSILRSNSLDDPNNLNPGQSLVIEFDDAVLINIAQTMKVSEFTDLYALNGEEFMQINYFDEWTDTLEEWWQVFVPLNQIEAEERGLIDKEEFFAIDLPLELDEPQWAFLTDGQEPESIEAAIQEQLVFNDAIEDAWLQQVINADGTPVAPAYEQTVIDSEETQRRLEEIKLQEQEAIRLAEEAEAQAQADAEAAEQARIEAQEAARRAQEEQTARAQQEAAEAQQRAEQAKVRAEQEAARAATEREKAAEQQRLAEQAEIVAAAPTQVQCPPGQCVHKGKCYQPPENAYCTDTDPANAWRCADGFTEQWNRCLSAEEIRKQRESVPAWPSQVLAQYYLNPHKLDRNVYGRWAWHCTAYAAYKWSQNYWINIRNFWTWNAKNWIRGAKNAWFRVDKSPAVGSLMVTDYGFWGWGAYGHVAYVEAVDYSTGMITVTDMNYRGRYVVTKRTEAISKAAGFIHPN